MFARIGRVIRAVIERIEREPNFPAGAYFGTFMLYWVALALSETHLVDAKSQWLLQTQSLLYYVTVAVGAVAAVVVPLAMLCVKKFRVAVRTLLVGWGAIAASYIFEFLTATMLFFISAEVDHWGQ